MEKKEASCAGTFQGAFSCAVKMFLSLFNEEPLNFRVGHEPDTSDLMSFEEDPCAHLLMCPCYHSYQIILHTYIYVYIYIYIYLKNIGDHLYSPWSADGFNFRLAFEFMIQIKFISEACCCCWLICFQTTNKPQQTCLRHGLKSYLSSCLPERVRLTAFTPAKTNRTKRVNTAVCLNRTGSGCEGNLKQCLSFLHLFNKHYTKGKKAVWSCCLTVCPLVVKPSKAKHPYFCPGCTEMKLIISFYQMQQT